MYVRSVSGAGTLEDAARADSAALADGAVTQSGAALCSRAGARPVSENNLALQVRRRVLSQVTACSG